MRIVLIRSWHVARAWGWRHGNPEADTLCGRRTNRDTMVVRPGDILAPIDGVAACRTCLRMARRIVWIN